MMFLTTIITAFLELTVVLRQFALGGMNMLTLGNGLNFRTLPTLVQSLPTLPTLPARLPSNHAAFQISHSAPIHHPSARPPVIMPVHPVAGDRLTTETPKVTEAERTPVLRSPQATDIVWLGGEVSVKAAETALSAGDIIFPWNTLPSSPPARGSSHIPSSLALYDPLPLPSGTDSFKLWAGILCFVCLSMSMNTALAVIRGSFCSLRSGFISLGRLHLYSRSRNISSRTKYHLNHLSSQVPLLYASGSSLISPIYTSLLLCHHAAAQSLSSIGFQYRRTFKTIGAFHNYLEDLSIRHSAHRIYLRSSSQVALVLESPVLKLWLDWFIEAAFIHVHGCLWEQNPPASMVISFGIVAWVAHRLRVCHIEVLTSMELLRRSTWHDQKKSDHKNQLLSDELHHASWRVNDLLQSLEIVRNEAASATKAMRSLHRDKQVLGHRITDYTQVVARLNQKVVTQENMIITLKASLDEADCRVQYARYKRHRQSQEADVQILELQLSAAISQSDYAKLQTALEEERAKTVSLCAELRVGHGTVHGVPCTRTNTEIKSAPVADSKDAKDECLISHTNGADPSNTDCDLVFQETIDDSLDLRDESGAVVLQSHLAVEVDADQAPQDWRRYVTHVKKMHAEIISHKDLVISSLECRYQEMIGHREAHVVKLQESLERVQRHAMELDLKVLRSKEAIKWRDKTYDANIAKLRRRNSERFTSLEGCIDSAHTHLRNMEAFRDKEFNRAEALEATLRQTEKRLHSALQLQVQYDGLIEELRILRADRAVADGLVNDLRQQVFESQQRVADQDMVLSEAQDCFNLQVEDLGLDLSEAREEVRRLEDGNRELKKIITVTEARARGLEAETADLRSDKEGLVRDKDNLEQANELLELSCSEALISMAALRDQIEILEAKIEATTIARPRAFPRSFSRTRSTASLTDEEASEERASVSPGMCLSASSASTTDLVQLADHLDLSMLSVSVPGRSPDISSGDPSYSQASMLETLGIEPHEESPHSLKPDIQDSGTIPAIAIDDVLHGVRMAIAHPSPSDHSENVSVQCSSRVLTPMPSPLVKHSRGKNTGFPSWESFVLGIPAPLFLGSRPVVDNPTALPALSSPDGSEDLSVSPLAARRKPENPRARPRRQRPVLSPLVFKHSEPPSNLKLWGYLSNPTGSRR